MIYNHKTPYEIDKALKDYKANHKFRTGQDLDLKTLKGQMEQLLQDKIQEMFLACFGTFTPKSVADAIEAINQELNQPQEPKKRMKHNNTKIELR